MARGSNHPPRAKIASVSFSNRSRKPLEEVSKDASELPGTNPFTARGWFEAATLLSCRNAGLPMGARRLARGARGSTGSSGSATRRFDPSSRAFSGRPKERMGPAGNKELPEAPRVPPHKSDRPHPRAESFLPHGPPSIMLSFLHPFAQAHFLLPAARGR